MLNFKPSKMTLALLSSGLMLASASSFAAQAVDANKKMQIKKLKLLK